MFKLENNNVFFRRFVIVIVILLYTTCTISRKRVSCNLAVEQAGHANSSSRCLKSTLFFTPGFST